MKRSARIRLHPAAFRHNLQQTRKAAPHSKVLAVIKANAYGHGMIEVAGILDEADGYAVACIPEGIELRGTGTQHPILVLQGHQHRQDLRAASEYHLRVVIHDPAQLAYFDQLDAQRIQIALKIDTGMHRLGIPPKDVNALYHQLKKHRNIDNNIWLMTHFACADDLNNSATTQQLTRFNQAIDNINAPTCIPNSAGILGWPTSHSDWIRPGIMLYGSSPFESKPHNSDPYNLQAAMTLSAPPSGCSPSSCSGLAAAPRPPRRSFSAIISTARFMPMVSTSSASLMLA